MHKICQIFLNQKISSDQADRFLLRKSCFCDIRKCFHHKKNNGKCGNKLLQNHNSKM